MTAQRNDDGIRIAEDSLNVPGRGEAGKRVEVAELSEVCLCVIVTDFATAEKQKTP
jgi:hypothetical protein